MDPLQMRGVAKPGAGRAGGDLNRRRGFWVLRGVEADGLFDNLAGVQRLQRPGVLAGGDRGEGLHQIDGAGEV